MDTEDRQTARLEALLEGVRRGRTRAVAAALTIVARGGRESEALLDGIDPSGARAWRVAVGGPPGSGKSTLIARLAGELRREGETVGILAVDPTSPFTGGAILGDRIRMRDVEGDPGVFIRSLGNEARPGGVSVQAIDSVRVLAASGSSCVIVETTGTGQSEMDALAIAGTFVLVVVPESGDAVQAMKAGALEAADVVVVNKADRAGARELARSLELSLADRPGCWRPRVVETSATEGSGVGDLLRALAEHRTYLAGPEGKERALRRAKAEVVLRARAELDAELGRVLADSEKLGEAADAVVEMEGEAREAARRLAARAARAVVARDKAGLRAED